MKMLSVPTASAEVRVFMRLMNGRRSYCGEPNPIALSGGDNSDVTNQVNVLCASRSARFSSRKMAMSVLQKFDFLQFSLSKFIELLWSYLKSKVTKFPTLFWMPRACDSKHARQADTKTGLLKCLHHGSNGVKNPTSFLLFFKNF